MKIPFTKAHGARNDFLLTWRAQLPSGVGDSGAGDMGAVAVAICDRRTGVGADGWLLVSRGNEGQDIAGGLRSSEGDAGARAEERPDGAIHLWNSDGSRSEISGNGTRCAAALLVASQAAGQEIRIATGAGLKHLRLLSRAGNLFFFEMNMGAAAIEELHTSIQDRDCVILNVGNPQCVFFVEHFNFEWQALGAGVERHTRFPNRTNVSFLRVLDDHTLEVRFFERGAGETMSSGTGSTGAAAAAVARGLVKPPVRVLTPAGSLDLRWELGDILLAGPAELVGRGEFYWKENTIK